MPLRGETVDRVFAMWRARDAVRTNVSIVQMAGEHFLAAPPWLLERLVGVAPDLNAVLDALGDDVERVIADVRLAYADDAVIPAASRAGVYLITDNYPVFEGLGARADPFYWREDWAGEGADARFVIVDDGEIVAMATYGAWAETVGSIGVFTDAPARGRGLSGRVAAVAAADAISLGLVAQWQSQRSNVSSERVADKLGFVTLGGRQVVRVRATGDASSTMEG
jgi:RimJ/RimL family protein N-acetyltransferase